MKIQGIESQIYTQQGLKASASQKNNGADFGKALASFVKSTEGVQQTAQTYENQFANSPTGQIHETMLAASKAEVAFKFMVSIRNKFIDAYREVMRMGG